MSDSIYSFRAGPTYRGSRQAHIDAAMDEPLSGFATFFDQAKGGALESSGLGTAIRDFAIPEGDPSLTSRVVKSAANLANPLTMLLESSRVATQALFYEASPRITEEQYKASTAYRENIPWDAGMTESRARALSEWDDAKRVREFYAEKRPITSFIGNFAGQALDPINYIPVAGAAVKAAAVARFGRVAGAAVTGSLDAAGNTALFALGTRERRRAYGDDVSWEMMTSEIAMAALIGAAFGTIGGVVEGRTARRAQDSLSTLKATQQARIALNDAIDGVVRGEDIRLGGNASDAIARTSEQIELETRAARVARDPQLVQEQIDRVVRQRGSIGEKPPAPASLMQFLAGKTVGGLKDESGELASMGLTGKFVPGRGKLVRQSGMSLDYARELAAEEGYFDHLYGSPDEAMAKSTPTDLLNLLSEEAGGKPAYRGIDQGMLADRDIFERSLRERDAYRSLVEDVNAAAKEMGLTDLLDDRVLVRAAELADSGHTADEALERALDEDYRAYADREADGFDDTDIPFFQEDAGTGADAGRQAGAAREVSRAGAGNGTPQTGRRIQNGRGTPAQEVAPGRTEAEARVGKPDDYKALADQYRVNPETGDFPEMADIDQLRAEGRLTDEDAAALDEMQAAFDDANAYGEAIRVAAGCLV